MGGRWAGTPAWAGTPLMCCARCHGMGSRRCRVSTASPRTSAPLTALRPARPAPPPLPACLLPACRGVTACEWLDCGSPGLVAGSLMIPSRGKLLMRLFDLATGRCLRASCCDVPPPNLPMEVGGTGAAVRCNTMQYNGTMRAGWLAGVCLRGRYACRWCRCWCCSCRGPVAPVPTPRPCLPQPAHLLAPPARLLTFSPAPCPRADAIQ